MDATKLIEEVTGLIGKLPALPWQQAPKQCGHTRCDCPLMQNYVRDAQDRTVFAVALEGSTDWKMRRLEGEIAAVLARLVSCVPELIAALKASEEQNKATTISLRCAEVNLKAATAETEPVKSANLAANKRIVELEYERDEERRKVDALLESSALLRDERDAARAELARLTTPRPIAEAPRDGRRLLLQWEHQDTWEVGYSGREGFYDKHGRLMHSSQNPPTRYLPLPEVKS